MNRFSPKNKAAFLPPLFDRLTREDSGLLDKDGVRASIQKEVSLMLNTRSSVYKRQHGFLEPSYGHLGTSEQPYSFPELLGLADFSFFDGSNLQQFHVIERHIEASLAAFEPRLKNPSVKIGNFDSRKQEISLTISGEIIFGEKIEPISFPLELDVQNTNSA